MIDSGSLVPGIDPALFRLPAGTAIRYERPAAALRPLFPSYAVLDSDTAIWKGPDDWLLPGWAQIWIVLTDGPIAVAVRNRRYAQLSAAVLYGGTSQAMPVTANGGVTVVIDISPLGWARLFDASAEELRDQIVPLDQHLPADWTRELIAQLHASDRTVQVKPLLDAFLLDRLPPPGRNEAVVARILAGLAADELVESGAVAAGLGLTARTHLRLCARHFGYGPKLLIRRRRFLRALTAMMLAEKAGDGGVVPAGYHDNPHFLRDGNRFLGMTPRRFLAQPAPYLRASLRARQQVLGAPLPMFDDPERDALD